MDINQYFSGSSPYDGAYGVRYDDGEYSLETRPPVVPIASDDIQHTVKEGETLQNIAYRYYKDSGKWYLIAEANRILNPFKELEVGNLIRIPTHV